jgi:hypothetical protein
LKEKDPKKLRWRSIAQIKGRKQMRAYKTSKRNRSQKKKAKPKQISLQKPK